MRDYMPGQAACDWLNRDLDLDEAEPVFAQLSLDWANGRLTIREALRAAASWGWDKR